MARQKVFEIKITNEQKELLRNSLRAGAPLGIALSYAKIPAIQYYYYVEVANVSRYFKDKEFKKLNDEFIKSGVSFGDIQDEAAALNTHFNNPNSSIASYKEPTAEAILRYKNNRSFKEFADEVYDFIQECDNCRSEAVMYHVSQIRSAAGKRGVNTNSSQWFLERAVPDSFGKSERIVNKVEGSLHQTINQEGDPNEPGLPPVKVEFVNPNTKENQDRVKDMEDLVASQLLGKDRA